MIHPTTQKKLYSEEEIINALTKIGWPTSSIEKLILILKGLNVFYRTCDKCGGKGVIHV
jgi:hypothetical protein